MSRENAAPEASPNEASAPKPNPLAKAKSFDGEYSSKNLTADDWAKRHATMGYDPLDRALMEERQKAGEGKGSLTDAEYKARVRGLLKEHIESMAEIGICFKHTFTSAKLGFAIALARYGEEGRQFVNVEETMPNCECYPGPLKPTDELIAVNGKVILEPTQHRFEDLRKAIAKAPRPLKMTFIQGERREEAFEEQEERRALSIHDKRDATTALDALLGVVKEAAALAVEPRTPAAPRRTPAISPRPA
ncbi:FMN binding protein [Aureococcus anophagefferens]|nr:FMN binding protein [Aureococcus anophagefferens]